MKMPTRKWPGHANFRRRDARQFARPAGRSYTPTKAQWGVWDEHGWKITKDS